MPLDFRLLVFFHESVSPKPLSTYTIRAVSNFIENQKQISWHCPFKFYPLSRWGTAHLRATLKNCPPPPHPPPPPPPPPPHPREVRRRRPPLQPCGALPLLRAGRQSPAAKVGRHRGRRPTTGPPRWVGRRPGVPAAVVGGVRGTSANPAGTFNSQVLIREKLGWLLHLG